MDARLHLTHPNCMRVYEKPVCPALMYTIMKLPDPATQPMALEHHFQECYSIPAPGLWFSIAKFQLIAERALRGVNSTSVVATVRHNLASLASILSNAGVVPRDVCTVESYVPGETLRVRVIFPWSAVHEDMQMALRFRALGGVKFSPENTRFGRLIDMTDIVDARTVTSITDGPDDFIKSIETAYFPVVEAVAAYMANRDAAAYTTATAAMNKYSVPSVGALETILMAVTSGALTLTPKPYQVATAAWAYDHETLTGSSLADTLFFGQTMATNGHDTQNKHYVSDKEDRTQAQRYVGGFILEEMGMGKTMETLLLILADNMARGSYFDKPETKQAADGPPPKKQRRRALNLGLDPVVSDPAPTSSSSAPASSSSAPASSSSAPTSSSSAPTSSSSAPASSSSAPTSSSSAPASSSSAPASSSSAPASSSSSSSSSSASRKSKRPVYKYGGPPTRYALNTDHPRPRVGTLIVTPLSLAPQWIREVEKCTPGLSTVLYHGPRRRLEQLLTADVVVTTYETVTADVSAFNQQLEHLTPHITWQCNGVSYNVSGCPDGVDCSGNKIQGVCTKTHPYFTTVCDVCRSKPVAGSSIHSILAPALQAVKWRRVVLDECQKAKAVTKTSALLDLSAKRRWCLSGTPCPKYLKELEGQLRFLGVPSPADVIRAVGLLKPVTIRHTKAKCLVDAVTGACDLPPVTTRDVLVELSPRDMAKAVTLTRAAKTAYVAFGKDVVTHATELQRAIQAACRVCTLTPAMGSTVESAAAKPIGVATAVNPEGECPICLEPMVRPVVLPCRHCFCHECTPIMVEVTVPKCALCQGVLTAADAAAAAARARETGVMLEGGGGGGTGAGTEVDPIILDDDAAFPDDLHNYHAVVKYEAVVELLTSGDPTVSTIIFSQYQHAIIYLKQHLRGLGLNVGILTGCMSRSARTKAVDNFNASEGTVLIIALRAAAFGLNLMHGSRVIFLEPSQNTGLELQAVGRVHRVGQVRPVEVIHLLAKGTIEERIRKYRDIDTSNDAAGATVANTSGNIMIHSGVAYREWRQTQFQHLLGIKD